MEIITILATAKQVGLDIGSMASIIMIYFMLKNFVSKQNSELKSVLSTQVDKIVKAIEHHNNRIENLEKDVKDIKDKLKE